MGRPGATGLLMPGAMRADRSAAQSDPRPGLATMPISPAVVRPSVWRVLAALAVTGVVAYDWLRGADHATDVMLRRKT